MKSAVNPDTPADNQKSHWERTYQSKADYFGQKPSEFGIGALKAFAVVGSKRIIDLGCGQGRDTFLFLENGLEVVAYDYSETSVRQVKEKARNLGLDSKLTADVRDVREGIPLPDESVDAIFSHMFFTMRLTEAELARIFKECHRVLKHGGLNIYSVRNVNDPHYMKGKHHGEDLWESQAGFVVQFFSIEKVQRLAEGYDLLCSREFDDPTPTYTRKLYEVVLVKP